MEHSVTVALSEHAPRETRHCFDRYSDRMGVALLADLRILSSEIVTNAVQHSGRETGDPIEIVVTIRPDAVRVEVIDQGEGTTSLQPRSTVPPSGLQYVELMSDRWSSYTGSFHVWFEIDTYPDKLIQRRPSP